MTRRLPHITTDVLIRLALAIAIGFIFVALVIEAVTR